GFFSPEIRACFKLLAVEHAESSVLSNVFKIAPTPLRIGDRRRPPLEDRQGGAQLRCSAVQAKRCLVGLNEAEPQAEALESEPLKSVKLHHALLGGGQGFRKPSLGEQDLCELSKDPKLHGWHRRETGQCLAGRLFGLSEGAASEGRARERQVGKA